jgi:GNAT superfamily N-acetyltransferase
MMRIKPAQPSDLAVILSMRDEARQWIARTGSNQWQEAWPTPDQQEERIAGSIAAGETWMLCDGPHVAGTLAIDEFCDPQLWTPAEQAEPAYYVHRMIVPRTYAGRDVGAKLLDWCCDRATEHGKLWVRIDVWTSNARLQHYYLEHKFQHVRTLRSDYPAGALFQRAAERVPEASLDIESALGACRHLVSVK